MVWWSNRVKFVPASKARTIEQECWNCGNRTVHVLHFAKSGVGFGNPLTGNMWVSTGKTWVLVCPTCEQGDPVDKRVAQDLLGERWSMVLIMGWGDKHDVLGATADRACERCLNSGPWIIYRSRKRLNVMFVPVARWGTQFAVRCTVCPNETKLSALEAHRLARGEITLDELK